MLNEKFIRIAFAVFFIALSLFSPVPLQCANVLSIGELLSNPNKYDKQEITIEGKVCGVQIATNRVGKEYTTFSLADEKGKTIEVFNLGALEISESQKVTVTGIYLKAMRVDGYNHRNEIKAKKIN